jgi:hypothetical protein
MVKTVEGSKRFLSGVEWRMEYGMGISVTFQTGETVQNEFRHIKEALINWQSLRGDACHDLMVAFTADQAQHEEIIDYVRLAVQSEEFLNPFFAKLRKLQFSVLTPDGKSERLFEVQSR